MSHQHDPAISCNLEETIPIIFPATDYDYVDPIFIHHLPPPPDYHHHYNDEVEKTTTAALPFWGDDDEKTVGTLESIVDQATRRLVSTDGVSYITHHGSSNTNMSSTWFGYNSQPIITATSNSVVDDDITSITTMVVSDGVVHLPSKNQHQHHHHHHQFLQVPDNNGVVLTNNTHGSEIERHRNGKEKEEEIYAVNNEAAEMDNYVVSFKCKDGWMSVDHHHHDDPSVTTLLTYTTTSTRSVVPDHHPQREGRKTSKKWSTTSNTNRRSKATVLHNKAERKRRDKISQRMEALQRLVPNICYKLKPGRCDHGTDFRDPFSKKILKTRATDKATMLDQVIEYIKKLQNEKDQMMMMMSSYGMNNNMTSYPMMIPMPYCMYMQQQQQQLQMSMMAGAQMAGMGVGLGSMHTNPIMHPDMSTTGTSRTPAIVQYPISITPSHNHS